MRIILEGTETELKNVIHFLSNPVEDTLNNSEIGVDPISDPGSDEMKALMKEHADRRRRVHQNPNLLSDQDIPRSVANYFKGKKLPVSYEKRRSHE